MAWKCPAVACFTPLLIALSPFAKASDQQNATVSRLAIDNTGGPYAFLATAGTRTTKPSCAASDDWWVISNPGTDNAKAMLAAIMTAYSLGRQVIVVGTGTCDSVATTREKVAFINTL